MGASITLAGESLIAQKQAAQQSLDVQRFIFANVPGLDPNGPVDRAAGKPAADRIVYAAEIPNDNAGFVNPNQVVYSLQVGSDVGDWDFNWIGLETAEGVLFAVAYVPTQQKRRNIPPLQLGNNITRNFLVVYDGAQALTGVTIDASTWQHDFTVRLAGIDERERQSNRDIFGRACFFGSALQVEKVGSTYQVKPGTAYVEGIRLQSDNALAIVPPALPTTAWLDVALQRELSDVVASWSVVFGTDLADRTDSAGARHYLVPIADLAAGGALVDRRPVEAIGGALVQHFAARVGDYPQMRARATTKADVGLSELPNAKSDDPDTDDSLILATTKAVKSLGKVLSDVIAKIVSGETAVGKAKQWATGRKLTVTGAVTGNVTVDGSADVTLNVSATQASEAVAGGAKVATQDQTNAGVDDSCFITPKKLLFGFYLLMEQNGYFVFPKFLGGLTFQWGKVPAHGAANSFRQTFPISFPSFCAGVQISIMSAVRSPNADSDYQLMDWDLTGFNEYRQDYNNTNIGADSGYLWFAWGR